MLSKNSNKLYADSLTAVKDSVEDLIESLLFEPELAAVTCLSVQSAYCDYLCVCGELHLDPVSTEYGIAKLTYEVLSMLSTDYTSGQVLSTVSKLRRLLVDLVLDHPKK